MSRATRRLSKFSVLLSAQCVAFYASAQEGTAQVGKALDDFGLRLRAGQTAELINAIQSCYRGKLSTTSQIAYCFTLDYSAMRVNYSGVPSTPYLEAEKVLTRVNRALQTIRIEQDQRGLLVAHWSNLARSVISRAPSVPATDAARRKVIEQARTAILRLARDPNTARPTDLRFNTTPNVRGEPTEVVCGRMAERTVDGKYLTPHRFVFFARDGSINYANGHDDLDKEIVRNFCVD